MHIRTAFIPLTLLLVLCSCGGEPEPIIAAPTDHTPASDSPKHGPPQLPENSTSAPPATAPSTESAKQFVKRFAEERATMRSDGDTSTFRAMSSNCFECTRLADAVDEVYRRGGRLLGRIPQVRALQKVGQANQVQIYELEFAIPPARLVNARGKVTARYSGEILRLQLTVEPRGSTWQTIRMDTVEE